MKKYFYLFATIGITLISSCGDSNKNENEENNNQKTDSLTATSPVVTQIDSIKGIAIAYWGLLEQADSTKFASIERLFDEISYNPAHDESKLLELKNNLQSIKDLSFNYDQIPNEDSLAAIDLKVDKYIREIRALNSETSGMEGYPLAKELSDTIKFLNETITLSISGSYAQHAKVYNAMIDVYKESLEKQGKSFIPLKLFFDEADDAPRYSKEELDALLKSLNMPYEKSNDTITTEEPEM